MQSCHYRNATSPLTMVQDEKEAQRKREHKAEIDRRRAAQQEESRRQALHRQETEKQQERERSAAAEDSKKIAQKPAFEKKRMDLQKDQHRNAINHVDTLEVFPAVQYANMCCQLVFYDDAT